MARLFSFVSLVTGIWFFVPSTVSFSATPVGINYPFPAFDPYGLSPFWNWKTFETPHFQIFYPEELSPIASRASQYFEETHSFLKDVLRWEPKSKTKILVIDNSDFANGLTSPFAQFGIILWATPPDSWISISYYDDWLRILVTHEYTHYLNMDATRGIWAPLRTLFGDALLPNAAWPSWMLEGLAVYMETRFSGAGRGRSPFYEMVLRAAAEKKVLDSPEGITLDKINGTNPNYPWGETAYLFGYSLINQLAKSDHSQDLILGQLSEESSYRIPFFINTTLEAVAGKTWMGVWEDWVRQTWSRTQKELEIIRSQPVTPVTFLTESLEGKGLDVLGSAPSPDGQWLAFTLSSSDRRQGLYLQRLTSPAQKTGNQKGGFKGERIADKLGGIGMRFAPDSQSLVYSRVHQENPYETFSDLELYCLPQNSFRWLTSQLRAKDPDVSSDGKWVTFTFSEQGTTGLARAPLISGLGSSDPGGLSCDWHLGKVEKLLIPPRFDRVSNPRFSINGEKIFFSLHPNGKAQEDLMEFDLKSMSSQALVADGAFNRFPAVHPSGDLYFVSNSTGADNLYRFSKLSGELEPKMVTNLTTGISAPVFSSESSTLYAGVFSTTGWNLAEVEYGKTDPVNLIRERLVLPAPSAPPASQFNPIPKPEEAPLVQDYSPWSTLGPRIWTPIFGMDSAGMSFGGQVWGFDATNQHRYSLFGIYGTQIRAPDLSFLYSNRTKGPALNFSGSWVTGSAGRGVTTIEYSRTASVSIVGSYPWVWTYSSLTPFFSLSLQKLDLYKIQLGSNGVWSSPESLISGPLLANLGLGLVYNNQETSHLAISPEAGRLAQIGSKFYQTPSGLGVAKFFLSDTENFRLFPHFILRPSFAASWTTSGLSEGSVGEGALGSQGYLPSAVSVAGRLSQRWLNSLSADSIDQLSVRGFPGQYFVTQAAAVTALDVRFPLLRIFRGWGTQPFFLDNLYALGFVEGSFFPAGSFSFQEPSQPTVLFAGPSFLGSAGGGVRLSTETFYIPLVFSAEYHQGFQAKFGGKADLFFQVLSNISF